MTWPELRAQLTHPWQIHNTGGGIMVATVNVPVNDGSGCMEVSIGVTSNCVALYNHDWNDPKKRAQDWADEGDLLWTTGDDPAQLTARLAEYVPLVTDEKRDSLSREIMTVAGSGVVL